MDVFQTSPGAALNPLPTTTGAQPVPSTQGQFLGRAVTSPPDTLSTPGMAPVSPHASATVARSTSQLSPARVSAPGGATCSGTPTGQRGISVVVNGTHVVVDNHTGDNLYTVPIGDSTTKPLISNLNLAALAICHRTDKKATIEQIVSWVKTFFPYYAQNYKDLESGIKFALNKYRHEFEAKTKRSGESLIETWKLKDEGRYFKYAGASPDSLAKRNLKKYSSDCASSLPAIPSALDTASGSGASAVQQRVSVRMDNRDIFIEDARGETLHTISKGSTNEMPSTTLACLIGLAIFHHNEKTATAQDITGWFKHHIPFYANEHDEALQPRICRELSTYKQIFKKLPYSPKKKKPYFWQLADEAAFFKGTKTKQPFIKRKRHTPATPKIQPPAAKKSRSQPGSSAGTFSISDSSAGGYLQPPPYSFAGGSLTASQQPVSTGLIPPLPHLSSGEYPVDQPAWPGSSHPGPGLSPSFQQGYPGSEYQSAGPGAYWRSLPPYPFPGEGPISDPQPFPGTVYPMPPAALGSYPYGQGSDPYANPAFPPGYPPVVVTTTNS